MVYLIHFETPFHHCQHYIGYSADDKFEQRIDCHKKNKGSRLIRAVNLAGINWIVARMWPNKDGNFERSLKNQKNAKKLCPTCIANKNKSKII